MSIEHISEISDHAPRTIRADRSGRYLVASDPGVKMVVLDAQATTPVPMPDHLAVTLFEISTEGQLLLAQTNEVSGYDLEQKSTLPLYSRGGTIAALAASPRRTCSRSRMGTSLHPRRSRAYAGPRPG
jgi:hypothetical protein